MTSNLRHIRYITTCCTISVREVAVHTGYKFNVTHTYGTVMKTG
jgi:hypothetical protein